MTTKHVHAEAMLEYAKDAMLTDEPWKLWQVSSFKQNGFDFWTDLTASPQWGTSAKYRRKPKVKRYLIVNGIEIEQTDIKPAYGTKYYIPSMRVKNGVVTIITSVWWDDDYDKARWVNSLVHDTAEAAKAHAEAMLKHDVTYG